MRQACAGQIPGRLLEIKVMADVKTTNLKAGLGGSRRHFVGRLTAVLALLPLLSAARFSWAEAAPLLSPADPAARKLAYVEDASKAKQATPPSHCGNCALYQGEEGSTQGPCSAFTGKQVKAAGWCSAWAPMM
jgi:hypothetical protein